MKVYQVVRKIPRGKTKSYQEIAKQIGRPTAFRAVANALNKNYDKDIPCHRVIRASGRLGGYNRGVDKKKKLLIQEGVELNSKLV